MDRLEHTGMTAAGADRGDFLHGLPVDYAKSNSISETREKWFGSPPFHE
jgi:hypothetical protein